MPIDSDIIGNVLCILPVFFFISLNCAYVYICE